ncbi:MAG TPA: hypothetical protein DCE31_03490 [Lautropia sp.]|nr:hypothetical protein [Lautropia sp.]
MIPGPSHQEFRKLLDEGLRHDAGLGLNKSTRDRLLSARRQALQAIPETSGQASLVHADADATLQVGPGGAAITLGYGRRGDHGLRSRVRHRWQVMVAQHFSRANWLERLFVIALLVLMLTSVKLAMEEAEVQVFMREGETDAKLLTNELPLDAYADRGFAVFLRNISAHGYASDPDSDQSAVEDAQEDDVKPGTSSGS